MTPVEARERPVWCPECHATVAIHRSIVNGSEETYGFLEMAAGMVALGPRSFGPPARPRGSVRSGKRLMVRTPGPVTIRCVRADCRTPQTVDVPGLTALYTPKD